MDGFLARTVCRIRVCAGLLALITAAAGANSEANALSISPSGSVPAQSILTVTWTPISSQNMAFVILVQVAPNGPIWFNNTVAGGANTGSTHITLPAGLNCGSAYIYKAFEQEVTPGAGELLTWGNAQGSYSPGFTIQCPRIHPLPFPGHVYLTPKIEGRESCPKGDQVENGKCVALPDSDKGPSRSKPR